MANIQIIEPTEAEGYLKEVYEQILESRGKVAEIYKIQSLNPRSIIRHMDLYITLMYGKSPLSRAERELIGVVVSNANRCKYCIEHHSQALNHFWKNDKRLNRLKKDYREADLTERELLIAEMAEVSTLVPDSKKIQSLIKKLKNTGFTDRQVLDTTLIIGYFNFVNRIVLNLDVKLEKDPGGYKYESS
jgi:uncharacterized peroxidase-related enzyme